MESYNEKSQIKFSTNIRNIQDYFEIHILLLISSSGKLISFTEFIPVYVETVKISYERFDLYMQ